MTDLILPTPFSLPRINSSEKNTRILSSNQLSILQFVNRMNLKEFLSLYSYIPAQTAILGTCNDGIPLLFDLKDESAGPLVVISNDKVGSLNLFQTMLHSLMAFNNCHEVKFSILSSELHQWQTIMALGKQNGQLKAVYPFSERGASEEIIKLAELAENRLNGRQTGFPVLLVIDNLEYIRILDMDARLNLEWLLHNGSKAGIWPITSIIASEAEKMSRWLTNFKTRFLGYMRNEISERLSIYGDVDTENLDFNRQFTVRINQGWLNFWTPILE